MRRRELIRAAAAAALLTERGLAHAGPADFPLKPIRLVVPNAPGGAADLTARAVAQKLAADLGQSLVVDNKPGAGGVVAGELVARAPADGHTLLLVSSGTAVSAALFRTLPFDTLRDFAPVSMLATFDLALVAAPGRFAGIAELLAWAAAHPGQLDIGTPNVGTTQHLAAELLLSSAGIRAQVVPFNGTPPVLTALRGGEIHAAVDILGPLMPQVAAGSVQPLAVLGPKRAAQWPRVPALRESGGRLAGFDVSSWNGLAAPAGTPASVVERLSRATQAAMSMPDVKARLVEQNLSAQGSTPQALASLLQHDIRRWAALIAQANIPRL